MSGLFGGGKSETIATEEPRIGALRYNTSAYGLPIPLVWGKTRIPGNLIWYGDFVATPHTTSQSSGGGGGGKGGGGGETTSTNTTYTYSTSLAFGLCEGPITGIGSAWQDKQFYQGPYANTVVSQETGTVPASGPYTITGAHAVAYVSDLGAEKALLDADGATYYSPLAAGVDYTVSAGVYTFDASLANVAVRISYNYSAGSALSAAQHIGFSDFSGSYSQSAWSYLTTYHAGQDLAYRGLAYEAAANFALGNSANLPNMSFEVKGALPYNAGTIDDANPVDVVTDLLTNAHYGAGFPSGKLASWSALSTYCVANGIFISPAYAEQAEAQQLLTDLVRIANGGIFYSEGLLKCVPFGDATITGNSVTFTPSLTPLYDLTDDDFLPNGDADPVICTRTTPADAFNSVSVEFNDRANQYNVATLEARDQANVEIYGLRPMQPIKAHEICDASIARAFAQRVLQRVLYIRNTFEFRLAWNYAHLEPMDIVTLTDSGLGLSRAPVRIMSIEEDEDGELSVVAEEMQIGSASASLYTPQVGGGYANAYNVSPGSVNVPVLFMAPGRMTVGGYEMWMAVSGQTPASWGGCQVWIATDPAGPFKLAGSIYGPSRHGVLASTFAAGSDPDTVNTAAVDLTLSHGTLAGGTLADANNNSTLSWIEGELISFQTATLTSAYHYTLGTTIRRGVYNTDVGSHAVGQRFVRLDAAIFKYAFDPALIGKTLYVKLPSFNIYGNALEDLAAVQAYTAAIAQPIGAPSDVTGFSAQQSAGNVIFSCDQLQDQNLDSIEVRLLDVGDTVWGNGIPLTSILRGKTSTSAAVPAGTWTFLAKARDLSGKYSKNAARVDLTVLRDGFTTIVSRQDAPDWLGTLTGFVKTVNNALIPDSTKAANLHTNAELFEQFVPYPVATCTYVTPEIDKGLDASARIWADIVSTLGRGVTTGTASPVNKIDYKLAAGAYDGFENWIIGTANFRYLKSEIVLTPAIGKAVITGFSTWVDNAAFTQSAGGLTVAAGGSAFSFPVPFHLVPLVQPRNEGATPLLPTATGITTTGVTLHLFNTSAADVGGTGGYDATGV
jgi:hypothetical protein